MAKRKLISEPASFPDLSILGIASQLKDYRMAFFLNRDTHLNLANLDDIPIYFEKEDLLIKFPIYSCFEADQRLYYYLIGNNFDRIKMIPEYKQADYLLFLKGQINNERLTSLISSIRTIKEIQLVFAIDKDKIKNLEGIMTDLEMHLVKK
ncbi:MAG: hypothetical protein CVU14_06395 [Bacteroidetes bacterium HGW-Bacteroidetes-9]|jgi:hypothetical protein|nr:MAG: hypothetical protein CVU14_06395 [Bacteroidetes bacterium HGW-Bacteroidetes-9]